MSSGQRQAPLRLSRLALCSMTITGCVYLLGTWNWASLSWEVLSVKNTHWVQWFSTKKRMWNISFNFIFIVESGECCSRQWEILGKRADGHKMGKKQAEWSFQERWWCPKTRTNGNSSRVAGGPPSWVGKNDYCVSHRHLFWYVEEFK